MRTTKFLPIALSIVVVCTLMLSIYTRVNGQDPTEKPPCTISTNLNSSRSLGVVSQKNCPACDFWYTEEENRDNGQIAIVTYYKKRNVYTDITACITTDNYESKCTLVAGNPMYQAPTCESTEELYDTSDDGTGSPGTGGTGGTGTNP